MEQHNTALPDGDGAKPLVATPPPRTANSYAHLAIALEQIALAQYDGQPLTPMQHELVSILDMADQLVKDTVHSHHMTGTTGQQ
jgi:hypothetical protein